MNESLPATNRYSRALNDVEPLIVEGEQGSKIALYRISASSLVSPIPIVLTHGTFSNGAICFQLAHYLADNGYDCWIYEWVGHGKSEFGSLCPDVEKYAAHDVSLVIDRIKAATNSPNLHWLAHSGGGFLPLMLMARRPEAVPDFRTVINLGSQTTEAGRGISGKMMVGIMFVLCHLLGYAPGPQLGAGPEREFHGFIPQWCRWNWSGRWRGVDGFDYFQNLSHIQVPTLSFAGRGDVIAPVEGCNRLWSELPHPDNRFYTCGKFEGFSEDFNHSRLIASRAAATEIWPKILVWLQQYS